MICSVVKRFLLISLTSFDPWSWSRKFTTLDPDRNQGVRSIGCDGCSCENGILALDTETTVVDDDAGVPDLVLASASDGDRHIVMPATEVADFLIAHKRHTLVFHNVAFDFAVLEQHFVTTERNDAREALREMARSNQLHDSMLLDQLVTLGRAGTAPIPRDLGTVADEFAGLQVNKDDHYRLRYAEIRGAPLTDVDCRFLSYAIADAVATIFAYAGLAHTAIELMDRHIGHFNADLAVRYGFLSEAIQVKAAIALATISRNGMYVDLGRDAGIRQSLEERRDGLVTAVESAHPGGGGGTNQVVFQRDNKGRPLVTNAGAPRLNKKALETALEAVLKAVNNQTDVGIEITRTPRSSAISLKAEHWIPLRSQHPFVENWLALNELSKLIQFTKTHTSHHVHPKYNVLVRSGRTSCSGPNIQQLPREGGIRECFIPSPGHVLLAVDYSFIELVTLAAVCEFRYGESKLADAIRAGIDPHVNAAALIKGMSVDEFKKLKKTDYATYRADRQRAKAINFGVPGGLGAASLMTFAATKYGVRLAPEEATSLREKLIAEIYPELTLYLAEDLMDSLAHSLGVDATICWNVLDEHRDRPSWLPQYVKNIVSGRGHRRNGEQYDPDLLERTWQRLEELNRQPELTAELAARQGSAALADRLFGGTAVASLTGRIRAKASYTQARNTPFQALAADGAKLALFRLTDAEYRVVAFVHDEVLIELPVDADHTTCANHITTLMCAAMQEVTCDVPVFCGKPALMTRWSKNAQPVYDGAGRLLVWQDEDDQSN